MKIDRELAITAVFHRTLSSAVTALKARLQRDYEQAYPNLRDIIHLVLDEEEKKAWELSFPHLFLPDLVEEHVARLNLRPADTKHADVLRPSSSERMDAAIAQVAALPQTVFSAMCRQIGLGEGDQDSELIAPQLKPIAQH